MQPAMSSFKSDANCPACGGPAKANFSHSSAHNQINYTLRTCTECDLQFWDPLEVDLSIYSDEGFGAYRDYHTGARPLPRWAEPLFNGSLTDARTMLDWHRQHAV